MESPGPAAVSADLVSAVVCCGLQRNELPFAQVDHKFLTLCPVEKGDAAAVAVNVDFFERLAGEVDCRAGLGADVHWFGEQNTRESLPPPI